MNDHDGHIYALGRVAPSIRGAKHIAVKRFSCDGGHADHTGEHSSEEATQRLPSGVNVTADSSWCTSVEGELKWSRIWLSKNASGITKASTAISV
jgi:hypothetical protein